MLTILARCLRIAALVVAGLGAAATAATAAEAKLLVFAAASLKNALDEASAAWSAGAGAELSIAYGGSAQLARQIEAGAPADLFLSANALWVDHLLAKGALLPETRRDLAANRLVLIGPAAKNAAAGAPIDLTADGAAAALDAQLGDGRLAMALVEAVPAGIYGKAALSALGLWPAVSDRVAETDHVRAALTLVAQGAAPLGVVYASDVAASDAVAVLARVPEHAHPPIRYPGAVTAAAGDRALAAAFLDHLAGRRAQAIFAAWGFAPVPRAAAAE